MNDHLPKPNEWNELDEVMPLVDKLFNKQRLIGKPTGFPSLDEVVGGMREQTLTVLAGGTGMGKSIIGLNILINIAKKGQDVAYFDLENGEEQSFERLIRIWYGLKSDWFLDSDNKLDAAEKIFKIKEHVHYYDHTRVYDLLDTMNFKSVFHVIRALLKSREGRTKYILIDPLQAFEMGQDEKTEYLIQGAVIRELKEIAQDMKKSIIVCHHLRKPSSSGGGSIVRLEEASEVRYRVPTIEDLKGSSKIADYATDVWGMIRTANAPEKEQRGKTLIRVLKNRAGQKGDVLLQMDEDTLRVTDPKATEEFTTAGIASMFDGSVL